MLFKVSQTTNLQGSITPPSSKSQTIRALLLASLASGQSVLRNALSSDDTQAAAEVCQGLGVKIDKDGHDLMVESAGLPLSPTEDRLYSGNSGITTRFFMPVLGLRQNSVQTIILDCGEQMKQRPVQPLIKALNDLGLEVKSVNNNGACPVQIKGSLLGGQTEVGGLTSQYLSALLLSLPCVAKDSEIIVKNLHERPYVAMTLAWLDGQRIKYEHQSKDGIDIYKIKGGQRYHTFDKVIPGDFSSASYLIAAGVLFPDRVELSGLDMNDKQGDKRLIEILRDMGADIKVDGLKMVINGGHKLIGKKIDGNDIPDLVPTLAVVGTQAQGRTEIVNVSQARIKETDRLRSMDDGLSRLGAKIEEGADSLTVYQSRLKGAKVHGYEDHRTVMALALAGLLAEGETIIDTAENINKTFPNYVELMRSLGAKMEKLT